MVDEIKNGDVIEYHCDIDGTLLWVEYSNGAEEVKNSCPHWIWERVGNGCYPEVTNEEICRGTDIIVRNSVKMIRDRKNFYFLLPRLRHYD